MSKLKVSHDPEWGLGTRTPEGQMNIKIQMSKLLPFELWILRLIFEF